MTSGAFFISKGLVCMQVVVCHGRLFLTLRCNRFDVGS